MRVTIDTNLKQITLHGSFKYAEFVAFHQSLPEEWFGYQYTVEPVYTYSWSYPYDTGTGGTPETTSQLPLFGDPVKSST